MQNNVFEWNKAKRAKRITFKQIDPKMNKLLVNIVNPYIDDVKKILMHKFRTKIYRETRSIGTMMLRPLRW